MTDQPVQPESAGDPLEERLVAYLDGELDDAEARQVESLVASNPDAHRRLQRLERTWAMLDDLGRAEVGSSFSHSTLELVTAAAAEDVTRLSRDVPTRRIRRWFIGSLAVVAAALIGFVVASLLHHDPDEQLLKDLPVIEEIDEYRQIDDFAFLEMLYREGLFKEAPDE
jgi:anti-sigma factor RsiW